jgi:branched-chain amino acid transport system permease protein
MMGVLNFAHASFYMIGAYFAYSLTGLIGFWPALILAPPGVGLLGAVFETTALRRVHKFGHVPELLITFGLSFIILEMVQLVWGTGSADYRVPSGLEGPLFTLYGTQFPAYRGFMMLVAVLMLIALWLLLTRTRIGLVIQAALTHPHQVEALGHNVPRVFMLVFGGGSALAGLAGVVGGNAFVTEPAMAGTVGAIVFVVIVVGGMGSLAGSPPGSLETASATCSTDGGGRSDGTNIHASPEKSRKAANTDVTMPPLLPGRCRKFGRRMAMDGSLMNLPKLSTLALESGAGWAGCRRGATCGCGRKVM